MRCLPLAVVLVLLAVAAPARADDVYTTSTCRAPDGTPAPTSGWVGGGAAPVTTHDGCASGGALTAGPATGVVPFGVSTTWEFTAPASTRIAGYALYRSTRPTSVNGSAWNWSLFRDRIVESPETYVERCWSGSGCS